MNDQNTQNPAPVVDPMAPVAPVSTPAVDPMAPVAPVTTPVEPVTMPTMPEPVVTPEAPVAPVVEQPAVTPSGDAGMGTPPVTPAA